VEKELDAYRLKLLERLEIIWYCEEFKGFQELGSQYGFLES
jgi:hypothetical protein